MTEKESNKKKGETVWMSFCTFHKFFLRVSRCV